MRPTGSSTSARRVPAAEPMRWRRVLRRLKLIRLSLRYVFIALLHVNSGICSCILHLPYLSPAGLGLHIVNIACFRTFKLCQHGAVQDGPELGGSSLSLALSLTLFFSLPLPLSLWRYDNVVMLEPRQTFFSIFLLFCFAVQLLIETPESILCPSQPRRALTAFFFCRHPNIGRGIRISLSAMQSQKE